jgi:hypothetical protein
VRLPAGGLEPSSISTLVLRRLDGDAKDGSEDFTLAVSGIRAGARLGPLPTGDYEVRLAAAAFRALPDRQHLRIAPGVIAPIHFDLEADGVLIGEVVARSDRVKRPAGSYQRAENAIQADVIRLAGRCRASSGRARRRAARYWTPISRPRCGREPGVLFPRSARG